eukprot:4756136-Pleurochrysis_carterae.AAC.1
MASGDVIVTFDTRLLGGGGGDNGGNHGDNNGGGGDGDGVKGACARGDLCGFGTATTLSQGSRHGVFACDASESATASAVLPVLDFLQKASEEELRRKALLPRAQRRDGSDGQGDHGDSGSDGEQCAVDTGIFSMSSEFVSALLAWAISPSEAAGPCALDQVRKAELYCDYYLEIVTACIPGLGVDEYIGRMQPLFENVLFPYVHRGPAESVSYSCLRDQGLPLSTPRVRGNVASAERGAVGARASMFRPSRIRCPGVTIPMRFH